MKLSDAKPPCKRCKARFDGCHEKCVDFLEYRKIHEREKAWQKGQTDADSFAISCIEKIRKEQRRRKKK